MSGVRVKGLVGIAVAGSLLFSTSAVAASTPASSIASSNPWASLSMMSGAVPAAAFCGSAATMAASAASVAPGGCVLPQVDGPPPAPVAERTIPVPPVEPAGSFYLDPLLIGIGVVAIGTLVYLLLIKKNDDDPVSPG